MNQSARLAGRLDVEHSIYKGQYNTTAPERKDRTL